MSKTIHAVFGEKHKTYIQRASKSIVSVAEGAVRAGKTIDNIAAFAWQLEKGTPDRIHLATGSTSANAKLNIGDANGFGLEYIFRGRCKWSKYRGNEALIIFVRNRQYIVIFAGGAKADSYKKIRGNSYGMWIATEINLHHDATIKEAFNRQLAAKNRKIFWDLNPSSPGALIYTDYIDRFQDQFGNGYNYEHFTIRDNATISAQRLAEIEAQYIPGSLWYRRDILGERCDAIGIIYQTFAENQENFVIASPPPIWRANIGVDFGGGTSGQAFVCVGFQPRDSGIVILHEFYKKAAMTPETLCNAFVDFVRECQLRWFVSDVYCDSAEQTLINGLRVAAYRAGVRVNIGNALKKPINERIRGVSMLMGSGRFKIMNTCKNTIQSLSTAVWDEKKPVDDVRLDDGTINIDVLDAMEYACERELPNMVEIYK